MDNFFSQNHRGQEELYATENKFIAMCFLGDLIEQRQAEDKRKENMKPQPLSQVSLQAARRAGKLPHIDINGTDFTIDWRLKELRQTDALEPDRYRRFDPIKRRGGLPFLL
ncbi:hypothetical protein [Mucilaginibacter gynuensis]